MRKSIVLVTLVLSRGLLEAQTGDQYWDKGFGIPGADLSGVAAILPTERGVLFAGNFSTIGGISASKVALWYRGNWFALGVGVTGFPTALATTHGQLYVGGLLYEAGGFPVSGIARWDGTNWAALGSGLLLGSGVNGIAFATASDGSNLFVGGRFDFAGGVAATNIAKWDGTNWSALGLGIPPVLEAGNLVGAVDSLTFEGGCLYVGGQFQQAGGLAATNIARWDGNYWQAIGHGLRISNSSRADNGSVHSLLSHRGVLYAGGVFKLAGEVVATNIARWSNGVWESVGHANNAVTALIPYGNGVVAGGSQPYC